MVKIEEIRSELGEIPNALVDFEPDRPPRIRLPVLSVNPVRRWEGLTATPVIHVDGPTGAYNPQNPELAVVLGGIDEDVLDRTEKDIQLRKGPSKGIDALAWYSSLHNVNPEWGIYIPTLSLVYIAERWLTGLRLSLERKLQVAFEVLHAHELFHFATDYMVSRWEILLSSPCWAALLEQKRSRDTYIEEEEKLANAYMLGCLVGHLSAAQHRAVEVATLRQPPGYSEGSQCVDEETFREGLQELTKLYVGPRALVHPLNMSTGFIALESVYPLWPELDASRCPVYLIDDTRGLALPPIDVTIIDRIPQIEETEPFKRALQVLPRDIQKRWLKKKDQLATRVPSHPEFERLKGAKSNIFSIRVGLKYRAHLQPEDDYSRWFAIGIGAHTEMGHG